jgi:hypothetical protein
VEGAVMKVVLTYETGPRADLWRAGFDGREQGPFGVGAKPIEALRGLLDLADDPNDRLAVRWAIRDEMVKDGSLPQ